MTSYADHNERMVTTLKARIAQLKADNTRLRVENIQMQAALGYAICAEDERHIIPSNPFKCGVCDARASAALKEK